jgi:hypothetical protein
MAEPAATAGNTGKARPSTEKPRRQEGQRGRIRMEIKHMDAGRMQ